MSLIAWYQLNGNLKNSGLEDNDLINSNSSVIVDNEIGKIGKCYEDLSTSFAYLESKNPVLLPQTHSMFCWIYPEKLCRSANLDGVLGNHKHEGSNPSNTGITLKTIDDNTYQVSLNTANTKGQRTYNTYCSDTILNINEWHHIGFTYNGETIKLYVDGKLDKEVNFTDMYLTSAKIRIFSWSNDYNYTEYTGKKKINDVRIYNHCLTENEVKDIYRTCVLHYNFEDIVVPYTNNKYNYTNILKYANQIEGIAPKGTLTKLNETFEGSAIWRLSMTPTTEAQLNSFKTTLYGHGIYINNFNLDAGQVKTFAILYKNITHKDTVVGGCAYNRFSPEDLGSTLYKDNWYRTAQKRTNNTANAGSDNWYVSFKCPSIKLNEEIIIDFCCPEEYSNIDFLPERISYEKDASRTIYDSSGYNHNGLLSGGQYNAIFRQSDIEGNHCLEFIGDPACYINSGKIFYDNINQCHTICAWVYRTSNQIGSQDLVNWNFGYRLKYANGDSEHNERTILYINNGVNDCYTYGNTLPLNGWHHIAFVFDRNNNIKNIYIDGKLANYSSLGNSSKLTPHIINKETYLGVRFKGYLDDIRIYATALSDKDIKQLYETKMKIDKEGNLYCNQFIEKENSSTYLTKMSILNTSLLNENVSLYDMKTKVLDDGSMWARIFWQDYTLGGNFTHEMSSSLKTNYVNQLGKYSRLNKLESFRNQQGAFEFLINYPRISSTQYNRWIQTANPLTTKGGTSNTQEQMGYKSIHLDYTGQRWKYGLASGVGSTFLSACAGLSTWYFSIGCYSWNNGFPRKR